MKLHLAKAYKSIRNLPIIELPSFSIITGLNGSGKSHFLEAIEKGNIKIAGFSGKAVLYKPFSNFTKNAAKFDPFQSSRKRSNYIDELAANIRSRKKNFLAHLINKCEISLIDDLVETHINLDQVRFQALRNPKGLSNFANYLTTCHEIEVFCDGIKGGQALREAAKARGVHVLDLSKEEVESNLPIHLTEGNLFENNISRIFADYHCALINNRFARFQYEQGDKSLTFISEEDFVAKNGPFPWDLVNKILSDVGVDYRVTKPIKHNAEFQAKLINEASGDEIDFEALSSGEKILISFALSVYNLTDLNINTTHPDILLLDEIDAPLHPSITKTLVDIIQNIFVTRRGMKVILATHSPSTVALSPEGSLFLMISNPRELRSCTKDEAVASLTSGMLVVTGNTRFVLTEATRDRDFYNQLLLALRQKKKIKTTPGLVFLEVGQDRDSIGGGCNEVKNWADKFPKAGMTQLFGIIDRDLSGTSSERIKVLPRYTIENYLLDPILIYAVLLENGRLNDKIPTIVKQRNYFNLSGCAVTQLQDVCNKLCILIRDQCATLANGDDLIPVEYVSGITLQHPKWLVNYPGHQLEQMIRIVVRNHFGYEIKKGCPDQFDMLCNKIPEFIPNDIVATFEELQN